jgi:hypothetical protein
MRITPLIFDIVVGVYTLAMLISINYYERKLDGETRKRLLGNEAHYTWLQLKMKDLDQDNQTLKNQNKDLKGAIAGYKRALDLSHNSKNKCACCGECEWPTSCNKMTGESRDMQYESSFYKPSTYANYTELELNRYYQDEMDLDQ